MKDHCDGKNFFRIVVKRDLWYVLNNNILYCNLQNVNWMNTFYE